jgi:hypothetical protein
MRSRFRCGDLLTTRLWILPERRSGVLDKSDLEIELPILEVGINGYRLLEGVSFKLLYSFESVLGTRIFCDLPSNLSRLRRTSRRISLVFFEISVLGAKILPGP